MFRWQRRPTLGVHHRPQRRGPGSAAGHLQAAAASAAAGPEASARGPAAGCRVAATECGAEDCHSPGQVARRHGGPRWSVGAPGARGVPPGARRGPATRGGASQRGCLEADRWLRHPPGRRSGAAAGRRAEAAAAGAALAALATAAAPEALQVAGRPAGGCTSADGRVAGRQRRCTLLGGLPGPAPGGPGPVQLRQLWRSAGRRRRRAGLQGAQGAPGGRPESHEAPGDEGLWRSVCQVPHAPLLPAAAPQAAAGVGSRGPGTGTRLLATGGDPEPLAAAARARQPQRGPRLRAHGAPRPRPGVRASRGGASCGAGSRRGGTCSSRGGT
mmetsp:Transcript_25818/g.82009  ORF Transcript_25818/g.82009 Transcript_25818/m.82009 type:complete len:329 (-) Transcript_25818:1711-2697(-)